MDDRALRIRESFRTVQLTMISIVLALALENLLERLRHVPLLTLDPEGILVGLQALALVATVLAMWSGFAYVVLFTTRPPSFADFVTPIVLLVLLDLTIRAIGTAGLVPWFAIAGVGSWLVALQIRPEWRMRKTPRMWRSLLLQVVLGVGGLLGALLVAVGVLGLAGATALVALFLAIQSAAAWGTVQLWIRRTSRAAPPAPEPEAVERPAAP